MSQSPDESRIREMILRLKRADEQLAPGFDDVLARAVRNSDRRPARRLRLAVVCCTVAALFVAFLSVGLLQDDSGVGSEPRVAEENAPTMPVAEPREKHVVEIDFDQLRRIVNEHFSDAGSANGVATANGVGSPLWSSRTESLLALNLDLSLPPD